MGVCMPGTYMDLNSVGNQKFGLGSDVDSAVLAATNYNNGHHQKL